MKKARYLAIILAVMLVFTSVAIPTWAANAESGNSRLTANGGMDARKLGTQLAEDTSRFDSFEIDGEEEVTAIVIFEESALIDVFSASSIRSGKTEAAKTRLLNTHKLFFNTVSFEFKVNYEYTNLLNGASITTAYKNLKALEAMDNVKGVYLANTYTVPEVEETEMAGSVQMTGADYAHSYGFTGQGVLCGVLDTGLNTTHEVFQNTDNLGEVALTEEEVNAIDTNVDGAYLSAKVPFAYDYADKDDDVTDHNGHGTHVSGTVCGYLETEEGEVKFEGAARGAQLAFFKIFADASGSTNSGIYFAALDDALALGVDVINMSIGSDSGFTYDWELENEVFGNVYEKLDEAGVIVCISAGNDYFHGYDGLNYVNVNYGVNWNSASHIDYSVVGSPSTYNGNQSIAAVNNIEVTGYAIIPLNLEGEEGDGIAFNDSSDGVMPFQADLAGQTIEYVNCGQGHVEEFEGLDLTGKFALVLRGDITFEEKLQNAVAAGAVGMLMRNNQAGSISMAITNWSGYAVSISQVDGKILLANIDPETGVGKCIVGNDVQQIPNSAAWTMCDFSSWGMTSDMTLKPTITAPGGSIYSSLIGADDAYAVYSGTSMACPNAVGNYAVLLQWARETYPDMDKVELDKFLESLTQSTAMQMIDDYDVAISPRKQGSGLIRTDYAMNAVNYILDPIVETYDSTDGVWTMSFTVENPTGAAAEFAINPSVLSDYPYYLDGVGTFDMMEGIDLTAEGLATFTTDCENDVLVFAEGETEKVVSITVAVNADFKDGFSVYFPNGVYVEGYVNFVDAEGNNAFHGTFSGFYGDWTSEQILEDYDFGDYVDSYCWLKNTGYFAKGYRYYHLSNYDGQVGYNEGYTVGADGQLSYYPGGNLMEYTGFDPDHVAFSNPENAQYNTAILTYPTMLRNARHMILVVSDAATGEVYYVDDTQYLSKSYYDSTNGIYQQGGSFLWDGTDLEGNYVDSMTKANFDFFAWLDYETDVEAAFEALDGDYAQLLTEDWADKNVWSFYSYVDYTAPVISDVGVDISTVYYGDADLDGMIGPKDSAAILRYCVGLQQFTEEQMLAADANRDGNVDVRDAGKILRYCLGLDSVAQDVTKLTITVSDEHYLADVGVYDNGFNQIAQYTPEYILEDYTMGMDFTFELDLTGYEGEYVIVAPMDYASNWPEYIIDLQTGECKELSVPLAPGEYYFSVNVGDEEVFLSVDENGNVVTDGEGTAFYAEFDFDGNYTFKCDAGYLAIDLWGNAVISDTPTEFLFGFDADGNVFILTADSFNSLIQRCLCVKNGKWQLGNAINAGTDNGYAFNLYKG